MKKEITIQEALSQGYQHYIYSDSDTGLHELTDLDPEDKDEESWNDLELADKEYTEFVGIGKEELAILVAEIVAEDNVFVDALSDEVYEELVKIDYSNIEIQIENIVKRFRYKMGTGVKIIKEYEML